MTFDGLTSMEGTIMDAVWARTDIDLTGYRKVMFEGLLTDGVKQSIRNAIGRRTAEAYPRSIRRLRKSSSCCLGCSSLLSLRSSR